MHCILELYSGIGGMHCSWNESGLPGEVKAAVDINTVANVVYKHNFPETTLINRNIQSMQPKEIKELNVDTILMSPPCQPFTRNGKCLDENDVRTESFINLINNLAELDNIVYILMENVKGFESSVVRKLFIEKLEKCGFQYQEFLLSPTSVGVPNSRLRYYCIARRCNRVWSFISSKDIMVTLTNVYESPYPLKEILQEEITDKYLIPDKLLKRANIFDICYADSKRSCCFTKAYSHYVEGTGSVFTDADEETVKGCIKRANEYGEGSEDFTATIKVLKLRFFTPREVLSLMSFPKEYKFPDNITTKQCYRLLGNSVNVKVISELLKILFSSLAILINSNLLLLLLLWLHQC